MNFFKKFFGISKKDNIFIRTEMIVSTITKDGKLINSTVTYDKKIVDTGLERIAKLFNGISTDPMNVIGIGTGTTAAANGDTELETEVTRESATTSYEADNKAVLTKTFTFGSAYSITEAGLFDSVTQSGSILSDRWTFAAKSVSATVDLYIKATITFARV